MRCLLILNETSSSFIRYLDTAQDVFTPDDLRYFYLFASRQGHIDVLKHLEAIPGFDKKKAASAGNYFAYQFASENGHIDALKHLEAIPGFYTKKAASAHNYWAYRGASRSGHIEVLKHLEGKRSFDIKEAASTYDYEACREASGNGHIDVLEHLEAIPGFYTKKAVSAHNYWAYREASRNGHIEVLKHLEGKRSFDIKEAASTYDYDAYRGASGNGHIDVLEHLEAIPGFDKIKAASADNYAAYRTALKNGHGPTVEHLLQLNHVFAYAEMHDYEFGESDIYEHVSLFINKLKNQKHAFEETLPTGVFDVKNEVAIHAFYVLRNLVRRGVGREYADSIRAAEDLSDDIRFLISIPRVKALCHATVTVDEGRPGRENELLRLSNQIGNRAAAQILLQLPRVNELARAANFYPDGAGLDLRALAQDRESSMVALSESERQCVNRVKAPAQWVVTKWPHSIWMKKNGGNVSEEKPPLSTPKIGLL